MLCTQTAEKTKASMLSATNRRMEKTKNRIHQARAFLEILWLLILRSRRIARAIMRNDNPKAIEGTNTTP